MHEKSKKLLVDANEAAQIADMLAAQYSERDQYLCEVSSAVHSQVVEPGYTPSATPTETLPPKFEIASQNLHHRVRR